MTWGNQQPPQGWYGPRPGYQPPGYPQQAYQAQGYPQPGYPPQGPPPKKRGPWVWLLPLLAVVVVAAVVVPIALIITGNGGKPAATTQEQSAPKATTWSIAPQDAVERNRTVDMVAYHDQLIVTTDTAVDSYDRATGKKRWETKPPQPSGVPGSGTVSICGQSSVVKGNQVALLFGWMDPADTNAGCTNVAILDLESGKLGWQAKIADPSEGTTGGAPYSAVVEFAGDNVVVGWDAILTAFRASDGSPQWQHALQSPESSLPNCEIDDLAPLDAKIILTAHCIAFGETDLSLATVDATGTVLASKDYPTGIAGTRLDGSNIVSASPLILRALRHIGDGDGLYIVLDQSFNVRSTIPFGPDDNPNAATGYDLGTGVDTGGGGHFYYRVVYNDSTLITVTGLAQDQPNQLVAYDLATGQRRWAVPVEKSTILAPVAIEGGTIVAVGVTDNGEGGPEVMTVDLADGKVVKTKSTPKKDDDASSILHSYRFVRADGRVYAVHTGMVNPAVPDIFVIED